MTKISQWKKTRES